MDAPAGVPKLPGGHGMSQQDALKNFGDRVGYTESDLAQFSDNDPRCRLIEQATKASSMYSIQAEVVESKHCNSGHKVGDRFIMDADGNLISKLCPKRMCVYALSQLIVPVALINERISEGLNPADFHFMRQVRCPDVGAGCDGYGNIMLKVTVVSRDQSGS
jgi:uncharacterized repeat protein (TIGR04076 family)